MFFREAWTEFEWVTLVLHASFLAEHLKTPHALYSLLVAGLLLLVQNQIHTVAVHLFHFPCVWW